MKIAVLFNSSAGGRALFHRYGQRIAEAFHEHTLLTCSGDLGENYLRPFHSELHVEVCRESAFLPRIAEAAARMERAKPDLFVCVGGDGFISYVADWMIRNQRFVPLLGVAGGTANVGPLIRFHEANMPHLRADRLAYDPVSAIEVTAGGRVLGYAFHDVVIGESFLGSVDGRMVNIAAAPFLRDGTKQIVSPSTEIVGDRFALRKNGRVIQPRIPSIGQIIASPIHHPLFYRGKAMTGALCAVNFTGHGAVVALSDQVLVKSNWDADASVLIEHVLFGRDDVIEMSGLTEKGHVILDGNPFPHTEHPVQLRLLEGIVTCARLQTSDE